MAQRKATIAGIQVSAISPIAWSITTGCQPFELHVEVHEKEAEKILDKMDGRTTVSIRVEGGDGFEAKKCYLLTNAPSTTPFYRGLVFADRRWLWQRRHLVRRFNVPRRTGDKHVLEGGLVDLAQIVDSLTFADWSLKNGSRWKARDVLENVLEDLVPGEWEIRGNFPDVPIENLEIDDAGDQALARALAFVPGAEVWVDLDGKVVVHNASDIQAGRSLMEGMKHLIVGGSVPTVVMQGHLRPIYIDVLFNREVELRFDSTSEGAEENAYAGQDDDGSRLMRNVAPSPDLELEVDGSKVYRGTYVRLFKLLEKWSTDLPDGVTERIDFQAVRRNWFYGLWNQWSQLGAREPDADWVARLTTVRRHFRQTYKLPRGWMRRIRSMRANRVAVIDPPTQSRAPALVQSDYCVQAGEKARWLKVEKLDEFFLWQNVEGYPQDGLIHNGKQAPALMTILDEDIGVLRFDYVLDPTRRADAIHPSLVENWGGDRGSPTHDFRYQGLRRFGPTDDSRVKGTNGYVQLAASHRVLTVFTAAPGAPNNNRQLHRIRISGSDIQGSLPASAQGNFGPPWEIRVSPAIYTVRLAWMDAFEDLYPRIFGFNTLNADGAGVDSDEITGEIWQNQIECRALARAVAIALTVKLSDHVQGAPTVHGDASLKPAGNADSVTHALLPSGLMQTTVAFSPELKMADLWAFLPSGIRTVILGQVQFRNP